MVITAEKAEFSVDARPEGSGHGRDHSQSPNQTSSITCDNFKIKGNKVNIVTEQGDKVLADLL